MRAGSICRVEVEIHHAVVRNALPALIVLNAFRSRNTASWTGAGAVVMPAGFWVFNLEADFYGYRVRGRLIRAWIFDCGGEGQGFFIRAVGWFNFGAAGGG